MRRIQLLSAGVIVNCVAAMMLMTSSDARAAQCGNRLECTSLNCHNPFWAQSACYSTLPGGCSYTTPAACYDAGTIDCPYMVLCQDQ